METEATDTGAAVESQAAEENQEKVSQESIPDFRKYKHRVKIDQDESEIDYDELVAGYQKAQDSGRKYNEAAKIKKEVDDFIASLKSGDRNRLIQAVGKDEFRKMAEEHLLEQMEYEALPQSEQDRRAAERERDDYKKRLEELENEQTAARQKEIESKAHQELETEILEAIKENGQQLTPLVIARTAEIMLANLNGKGEKLGAGQALKFALTQLDGDAAKYLESLPVEELRKRLPKKTLDALRKADLDLAMSQNPVKSQQRKKGEPAPKRGRVKDRRMQSDDWFKKMDEKFGS